MKKYFIFIIIAIVIVAIVLFLIFRNNFFKISDNNTSATKLSANISSNSITNNKPKEEELSSFATEIRDNSPGRLTNISITCSLLNNTIVRKGETFSFNEIVGQPSTAKGYKEATVIIDGEHEKGIGGRKLPS